MNIFVSALHMPGVESIRQNPLPVFRNPVYNKNVQSNGTLQPEEVEGFGRETADRVLPYLMQDRYTRQKKEIDLKTIVMDNGILRAEFLADFGGKLHSLIDLRTGRNLIFSNPVLQPGNLSIRNAWLSGGIEWNIGQFGHTFTTCSPVFFAKVTSEDGENFLRLYEYERQKKLFWQVDFHLPDGSEFLQAYVRIVNDYDAATPMYWWTNIACVETPETRVFSATSEVFYQDRDAVLEWVKAHGKTPKAESLRDAPIMFGRARLPYLESSKGKAVDFDMSYPQRYPRSNEFFFKNPETAVSPWEAATYKDGFIFFERSTQPLLYRKMFCWGVHRGGRLWCDYLSEKGKGDYIELQGGLTPTQLHGFTMAANSEIEFSQLFGSATADAPEKLNTDWASAREYVEKLIERHLPVQTVLEIDRRNKALATLQPDQANLLHVGSGWGALEVCRRAKMGEKPIPMGFIFPDSTLGREQMPWIFMLKNGYLAPLSDDRLPVSYMVDPAWKPLLEKSLQSEKGNNINTMNCLATLLYENGQHDAAISLWQRSIHMKENPLAYRNLAFAARQRNDMDEALENIGKAYELEKGIIDKSFTEEYMQLLIENKDYETAWRVFAASPQSVADSERVQVLAGQAAIQIGEYDFLEKLFHKELAIVREGETVLSDLWFCRQAMKLAQKCGTACFEELLQEIRETLTPPENIDFRMFGVE